MNAPRSKLLAQAELAAVALVLVAWALNYALRDPVDLSIEVSGTRVFPLDLLAALLAATAVVRAVWQRRFDLGRILAFLMLALVAVYGIRGVLSFDLETGANGARTWFYFAAALAFAATSQATANRQYLKLIIVAGFALAVAGYGMLLRDSEYKGTITYDDVLSIAREAAGEDRDRRGFVELVEATKKVAGGVAAK